MNELQELTTLKTIQEPRPIEIMATMYHCLFGIFNKWWMVACDRDEVEWEGRLWLRRN